MVQKHFVILIIAFFSIIFLWNVACVFGYEREGMKNDETEGDESKEEETEEKEEEELLNQSRSRSQNLSEGSIGDFFFVGGSPNNTNMNI